MSHLKFNIPHLDLPMVGCLQGPSVPDGGVGSARRGREALQWRTSRGDVLSHANCPPKASWRSDSELQVSKPDSLVDMIMDMT